MPTPRTTLVRNYVATLAIADAVILLASVHHGWTTVETLAAIWSVFLVPTLAMMARATQECGR